MATFHRLGPDRGEEAPAWHGRPVVWNHQPSTARRHCLHAPAGERRPLALCGASHDQRPACGPPETGNRARARTPLVAGASCHATDHARLHIPAEATQQDSSSPRRPAFPFACNAGAGRQRLGQGGSKGADWQAWSAPGRGPSLRLLGRRAGARRIAPCWAVGSWRENGHARGKGKAGLSRKRCHRRVGQRGETQTQQRGRFRLRSVRGRKEGLAGQHAGQMILEAGQVMAER